MKAARLVLVAWLFGAFPALAGAGAGPSLRVVALSPALAEVTDLLIAAGHGPQELVGVTDYADTPPHLKELPSVGAYSRFSLEKVVALKPDLVLATEDGNPRDQIEHLRGLGKRVVVIRTRTLDEVGASFGVIGDALGVPAAGKQLAEEFQRSLAAQFTAESRAKHQGRSVALQLGDDPLIFIGGGSFTGDLVQKLGYAQVFGDSRQTYPRPSREYLLAHPPDEIWVLALGGDAKPFEKMRDRWRTFRFAGGKTPVLKLFAADDWVRPTPRLVRAAQSANRGGSAP